MGVGWRWPTRHELRDVTRLAFPIVLAQLGVMLMGTVDVLLVGRVSPAAIAAVGAQVVATGILRGAADTRAPMLMNLVGYFALSVPIAALLGFALGYGAVGIWWGLVAGLAGAASLLTYRGEDAACWRYRSRGDLGIIRLS